MANFIPSCLFLLVNLIYFTDANSNLSSIRGKLTVKREFSMGFENWLSKAHVFVDGGKYIGVPNREGEFSVSGLPNGESYLVEISHPTFVFPRYRVDITTKGKIRAKMLNNVDTSKVEIVKYPMVFEALGKAPYFEKREEWKITDMIKNPMVLMLVLPMVLMFIMPKMMNAADEETKKEMESSMNMLRPNQNMPDISEMVAGWFGGPKPSTTQRRKVK